MASTLTRLRTIQQALTCQRERPLFDYEGRRRIVQKSAQSGTYWCNGVRDFPGCGNTINEPSVATLENGYVWHLACLERHGFKLGMVASGTNGDRYSSFSAPSTLTAPDSTPKGLAPHMCFHTVGRRGIEGGTTIRTQKALGVAVMERAGMTVPPSMLIQDTSDLAHIHEILLRMQVSEGPLWGRPCPPRARHGFVDSRPLSTAKEVGRLWRETRQADRDSELLLQPMIPATVSGILTPNAFTFGPGNDGATSGKSASMYRLGETVAPIFSVDMCQRAGIAKGEVPYTELVWEDLHTPIFVQLRSGPDMPAVKDYVPANMQVAHVFTVNEAEWDGSPNALLRWEALVPTFPFGTVVYHPGGALSSHFGVHCFTHRVAYVTTRQPSVGEKLTQCLATTDTLIPEVVRHGILLGAMVRPANEDNTYSNTLLNALFVLHNVTTDQSELGSRMLGMAASNLFRIMSMACMGEMRHLPQTHDSQLPDLRDEHAWLREWLHTDRHSYDTRRHRVFDMAWEMPHATLVSHMRVVARAMLTLPWSAGMGGLNWGRCTLAALRLHEALAAVVHHPTSRATRVLIERMNVCVNLVHNNGSLFNKFVQQSAINQASSLARGTFLNATFPKLVEATERRTETPAPLDTTPSMWRKFLPKECVRFAEDPQAVKRCYEPTGRLEDFMARRAALCIMETITKTYDAARHSATLAVSYALYGLWTLPVHTPCRKCKLPRYLAEPLGEICDEAGSPLFCMHDCDLEVTRYGNAKVGYRSLVNDLGKRERRSSLATCRSYEIVDEQATFVFRAERDGSITMGWRYPHDPGRICRDSNHSLDKEEEEKSSQDETSDDEDDDNDNDD